MSAATLRFAAGAIALGSLVSIVGCKSEHDKPYGGGPRTADDRRGPHTALDSAASSISHAKCEREQRCGNVGKDKKWASVSACVVDQQKSERDDLADDACKAGVLSHQLDACIDEIRKEECGAFHRASGCSTGDLCAK